VWFHWDGRKVYFNAAPGSQKHVNLQHCPWAVVHLGDGDDVVILEGAAEVVGEPAELRRVDGAYRRKYVDPHSGASAGYPEAGSAIPYRLDIRRIIVWEYGVVTTRTDFLPDTQRGWAQTTPSRI
jgi:hypothetical protein